MSDRLKNFLIAFAESPRKRVEFDEDPDAVLARSDLSPEEQAAVKSRDKQRIGALISPGMRAASIRLASKRSASRSRPTS
jgi:hypothetical protein